jgi:hypothetical protein
MNQHLAIFAVLREDAGPENDDADTDTGKEISRVKQDAASLYREWIAARLEPASIAERQMHRQIGHDRDDQERDEGRYRVVTQRKDQQAECPQDSRRHRPDRGGDSIEHQQNPQEPRLP